MSDRDCAQQGHHWHEADGSIFSPRMHRPKGEVALTCCHCGGTQSAEASHPRQRMMTKEMAKYIETCGPERPA